MTKRRVAAIAIALGIIIVILGAFTILGRTRSKTPGVKTQGQIRAAEGIPVSTAELKIGDIEETIPITGDIKALTEVNLSAKIPGRVTAVTAGEGDRVRAGQALVVLDPTDAESQVRSASAAVSAANARLSQAITTAQAQERQSDAAIAQARAGLEIAQAHLAVVRKGARTQERLVAQNAVNTAKANLDNAESNYKRYQELYGQGAVSAQQLDTYRTQYDVAKAQYDSAVQQLSLIREGARPEDVEAAEGQAKQARESLRIARANASQVAVRWEDVKGARAAVQQAEAALTSARQQLDYMSIKTTTSGVVASRSVEPGQIANPGMVLMTVVNLRDMYFEADLSEVEIGRVSVGQPVAVGIDALPGRGFAGRVAKILPVASTESRNFAVRIHVPNPQGELRPGMFARGEIGVRIERNALLVPKDALVERYGDTTVFAVERNAVKAIPVRIGVGNTGVAQILEPTNLAPGQRVVTEGRQGLRDGSKIYVKR